MILVWYGCMVMVLSLVVDSLAGGSDCFDMAGGMVWYGRVGKVNLVRYGIVCTQPPWYPRVGVRMGAWDGGEWFVRIGPRIPPTGGF